MRFNLVLAALLCFITWMSMVDATQGPVSNCCLGWSTTTVPVKRIVDYTMQSEGACPIKAVLLRTIRGKTICSDPDSDWGKSAILKVDEKKKKKALQEMGQNEDGSTSDITSAASPASNTRQKKKVRRQRKKSKKGRSRRCV